MSHVGRLWIGWTFTKPLRCTLPVRPACRDNKLLYTRESRVRRVRNFEIIATRELCMSLQCADIQNRYRVRIFRFFLSYHYHRRVKTRSRVSDNGWLAAASDGPRKTSQPTSCTFQQTRFFTESDDDRVQWKNIKPRK